LLDASSTPFYAVDDERRIVYCNRALTSWLDLSRTQIVGRLVEYHSEPAAESTSRVDSAAPLTDLCPPPSALAGEPCMGTISRVARDGGLAHRRANFLPLGAARRSKVGQRQGNCVLVILSDRDLTPQELAADLSGGPTADELHRTIRQFRRAQSARYAVESLLGESSAMRKLRSQVAAAAACRANTLICGRPGTGRGHVARAIHYRAVGQADAALVPVDCRIANEDVLRRAIGAARDAGGDTRQRSTIVLENLDHLADSQQSQLLAAIRQHEITAQWIATCGNHTPCGPAETGKNSDSRERGATSDDSPGISATIVPGLIDAISTITIHVPRLRERLEDLPILAQFFVEAANRDRGKQLGGVRSDALDILALYSWPGELDELRAVIVAAHRACGTHEITAADLPDVVQHASTAARRMKRQPVPIVLDELLAQIEREAIVRALGQSQGNKTEAAELLGMTRPRLYRRLVQLGLAGPEFIEQQPGDESQ
jgi:DNA-binding NtrC family response regulator